MVFIKRYLKYILLAVVFTGALIALGVVNIKKISDVESKKSSYTRTQFDYFISSPDAEQVSEIEGDSSVEKVFPFYTFKNAFGGGNSGVKKIDLLVSDDMDDYSISLMTEKTCVKGSFDKDGAMLDLLAAENLGVSVGDTISFTVLGKRIERKVAAIYLTSTYGTLTNGLVLVNYSDEIKSVYNPRAYNAAFLTTSNKERTEELLRDYVGEGNIISYEEFMATKVKPPYQTEEEFDAKCREEYAARRASDIASIKKGNTQVVFKLDLFTLVKDSVATTEKSIDTMNLSVLVSAMVLFIMLGVIFTITNGRDDRLRCNSGQRFIVMFGGYALLTLLTALVIAALTGGILFAVASATFFADMCLKTILMFALSTVAACPVVICITLGFIIRIYRS